VTDDYVLLQAQQLVGLATDGGFAQHLVVSWKDVAEMNDVPSEAW
jgi:D-arabinose 1-dehydrogenase-like Zn-dependent alcohol dehydrogenase